MKPSQAIIPNTLDKMLEKVLRPIHQSGNMPWAKYATAWITDAAENEYKLLTIRERTKNAEGTQITRLLRELANANAITKWHERQHRHLQGLRS